MTTIASRLLTLRGETGNVEFAVRVFAPEPDGASWTCRYEIDWPHARREAAAGGFDSMQSLVLALQMIAAEIYTSDEHQSGKLMWVAPEEGYGFPAPGPLRELLTGNDAKYF